MGILDLRGAGRLADESRILNLTGQPLGGAASLIGAGTAAGDLLADGANGLAWVASDQSFVVRDTGTPANEFSGAITDKWTYTAPSSKYVRNASGVWYATTAGDLPLHYRESDGLPEMLLEPQATNLFYPSVPTSATWLVTGAVITDNYADGPDGVTNSASRLNATTSTKAMYKPITIASGTTVTISAIVKRSGAVDQTFRFYSDTANILSNNKSAGSSFARFSHTGTTVAGGTQQHGIIRDSASNNYDILPFAMQIEVGSKATSPIPTTTGTVTRAADDPEIATTLFPWNGGSGTLTLNGSAATPVLNGSALDLRATMEGAGETSIETLLWVPA